MAKGTGNTVTGNWYNADGLPVYLPGHYADSGQRVNKATQVNTLGAYREIVIPFDLSKMAATTTSYTVDANNDGVLDQFSEHDPHLPAYSTPIACRAVFTQTAVGGTSITVGSYKLDGTIVSANAFLTATEGVTANMVIGQAVIGAGAAVTVSSGTLPLMAATNTFVGIVTAGTFTAGKGFIVISYLDLAGDPELFTLN